MINFQNFMAIFIVFISISIAIYKIVNSFRKSSKGCGNCNIGNCGGCAIHEINKKKHHQPQSEIKATASLP